MKMIDICHVSKQFGERKVLEDISFSVKKGTVVGFVGENGAGKTTTMKMILGLLTIDDGTITVCDHPVKYGETTTNRSIGYLPDVPQFYSYMTAKEYLTFCGKISAIPKTDLPHRVEEVLNLVDLTEATHRISGFSRGMKQRLGLAQALINRPAILICDEPTSALDPIGRKDFLDIFSKIKGETTILFSSHILSDVEQISDSVAILHQGSIRCFGPLETLKATHAHATYTVSFNKAQEQIAFVTILEFLGFSPIVSKNQLTIHQQQGTDIGGQLIQLLNDHAIVPKVFRRDDPSLESLYLEVIK